jgi:hypothetical protein
VGTKGKTLSNTWGVTETSHTEDELLIEYDSELNNDDIIGYNDRRDYSTDDTYPY